MWNLGPRFGKPEEHGSPTIAVAPCILAGMLARRTTETQRRSIARSVAHTITPAAGHLPGDVPLWLSER